MEPRTVIIVGGVAGGASCAARLRRLDESLQIVLLERGPYVSFANCGLPYYVGEVIEREESLLVAGPELFRQRFNIEVKTRHEVVRIDRENSRVEVRLTETGQTRFMAYDELVLAPGAAPIRPPLPGIDSPGIFCVRTIPDARRIRDWIDSQQARRAVIVGGGFIGLEMAENLVGRGLEVTMIEMADQVMPPLDPEMALAVENRLRERGVSVRLGEAVAGFTGTGPLVVRTAAGTEVETDMVILAIGVRPEVTLAREAGLEIGQRGGIRVDEQMRTSAPHIWAVGDAVEVKDWVTGDWTLIPLAGPANLQGRIAADNIAGRQARFRGVQGTAIVSVFGLTAACTGASEKSLRRLGRQDVASVYLHPGHHAGYYPGALPLRLKLTFSTNDGRILGFQATGEADVDKRVDVVSTFLQQRATVFDMEEAQLCYAPQFGSAKDPINLAGMLAANVLRGDVQLADGSETTVLDVRSQSEHDRGHVEGSLLIPLPELRSRLSELPPGSLAVYCAVGQRAYYAVRLLRQKGYEAHLMSGGFRTHEDRPARQEAQSKA